MLVYRKHLNKNWEGYGFIKHIQLFNLVKKFRVDLSHGILRHRNIQTVIKMDSTNLVDSQSGWNKSIDDVFISLIKTATDFK